MAAEATADGSCRVDVASVNLAANVCVVVLVTIFVGFPDVMIAVVYDIVVFVLEAAAICAAARFSAAATRRGAVPLVTGGGKDPPSLADDVERRGISGTGVPTTAEMGLASNDVGPTPSKDGPCTFTAPLDLAAEDLVLDVTAEDLSHEDTDTTASLDDFGSI